MEQEKDNNTSTKNHTAQKDADIQYEKMVEFQGLTKNYQPVGREMELMRDTAYITGRLDKQIDWYDRKSTEKQLAFKKYKRLEFIIAASIPVLISFSTMSLVKETAHNLDTFMQILAAISGVVLVILNKVLELEDYFQLWKDYRMTCEALQHERMLYLTKTEPYDEPNAFPMLVERIESILHKEMQKWKQVAIPKNQELLNKVDAILSKDAQNINELGFPKQKKDDDNL